MPTIANLIESINAEAAEPGRAFYVAGAARDCWPVLVGHLDALHPTARMAVEHYAAHVPSCQRYREDCGGCRE